MFSFVLHQFELIPDRDRMLASLSSTSSPGFMPSSRCRVCWNEAQGSHFGAQTCRACGAFFRRTVVLNLKYKCRKADKQCFITKNPRNHCRYCRYQKCVTVGMIADNVQYNRDASSSTIQRREENWSSAEAGKAMILDKPPGWRRLENKPPVFDLTSLFRRIKRVFTKFKEPTDPFYAKSNTLMRMDWVLRKFRRQHRGECRIRTEISFAEVVRDRGGLTRLAAEWMMHSEEFRELCVAEKFRVFMETWQVWERLCNTQHSCEIFGRRVVDEKLQMLTPNEACRLDNVCVDLSSISTRSSDEIRAMFQPALEQMLDEVVKPLLDLQPTSIETTYLLCYATFTTASKAFPGSISDASDRLIERVSNDLHEYYAAKQEKAYAARLLKLMGTVNSLKKVFHERRKIMELAELFDIIASNISEPKMHA